VTRKSLRNLESVHLLVPGQLNTYDVLVSDDVVFTEGALAAFLSGAPAGRAAALGEAVETLAAEAAPRGGRRTTGTRTAPAKEDDVSDTPATDKGSTAPAGAGVSDEELAAEVADQTSSDVKAAQAFEQDAATDTGTEAAASQPLQADLAQAGYAEAAEAEQGGEQA
jgi:hypothetical protein